LLMFIEYHILFVSSTKFLTVSGKGFMFMNQTRPDF